LVCYLSGAVGRVLVSLTSIVYGFAQFRARQIERSSVEAKIASLLTYLASIRRKICQDNFQIAILQTTGGDIAAPIIDALKGKFAAAEQDTKRIEANSTLSSFASEASGISLCLPSHPTLPVPPVQFRLPHRPVFPLVTDGVRPCGVRYSTLSH
jgi:hypothetical protein